MLGMSIRNDDGGHFVYSPADIAGTFITVKNGEKRAKAKMGVLCR